MTCATVFARFAAAALLVAAPTAAQTKLYFLGNGIGPDALRRSDTTGGNKEIVIDGVLHPDWERERVRGRGGGDV